MISSRIFSRSLRSKVCSMTCLRQSKPILNIQSSLCAAPRAFATTASRLGRGITDKELSAKLASEYAIETEMNEEPRPSLGIQEFIQNGPFAVTDIEGNDEVVLERQFGNETIRIVFSISEIDGLGENEMDVSEDAEQNETITEEDTDVGDGPGFPVHCAITIRKDGTESVLALNCVAEDGNFLIENIALLSSMELALGNSAESEWKRSEKYLGPTYANLDEDLQVLMEKYLEERGINTPLALFIPDYIYYKEGREYENWLQGLKQFVDV